MIYFPDKGLPKKIGSNEGDTVIDTYGGSGTTAEACARLRREFKIIEELDYAKTHIKQRIDNMPAVEYAFANLRSEGKNILLGTRVKTDVG
jgi:DNA modification methylase